MILDQSDIHENANAAEVVTSNSFGLTEAQSNYIVLDRQYAETIKPFFDQFKAAKEALVAEGGVGRFFQDGEGVVYKTDEKLWSSVPMEHYEIKRTRREGETKGTLSLTEAREAGFVVEGK